MHHAHMALLIFPTRSCSPASTQRGETWLLLVFAVASGYHAVLLLFGTLHCVGLLLGARPSSSHESIICCSMSYRNLYVIIRHIDLRDVVMSNPAHALPNP